MTRPPRPVEGSAKVYAALLRAYPTSFRRDYGEEMALVFRELASDAWNRGGWLSLMGVWCRVFIDLARTLPQQHYLACLGAPQPRRLTPLDFLTLVTGFAVALALPSPFSWNEVYFLLLIFESLPVVLSLLGCLVYFELAIAFVIFLRRYRYGAMPRSAEWLAILVAMKLGSQTLPNVDTVINHIYRITSSSGDFGLWRWTIAGVALLPVLAGLAFLWARGRALPEWLRTFLLSAMALALFWGPLPVLSLQAGDFYFPLLALAGLRDGWCFWLALSGLRFLSELPCVLLFAIPSAATCFAWRGDGRQTWIWTEWASAVATALLGLFWLFLYYFCIYMEAPIWISDRIVTGVGLVAAALLSAQLVRSPRTNVLLDIATRTD